MTEARYRGQKTVVVSPGLLRSHTKFADHWLPAHPGTDGALAMAHGPRDPQGVLRRPPGPVLPGLRAPVHRHADAGDAAGARRRPRAGPLPARLGPRRRRRAARGEQRRLEDRRHGRRDRRARPSPTARSASAGARRARAAGTSSSATSSPSCRCSARTTSSSSCACRASTRPDGKRRGAAARRAGQAASTAMLVATVFDLICAHYGVGRDPGLPGDWPNGATTTRSPTRPPGRRRSPASTRDAVHRASRASSPATPSRPTAAR